MRALLWVVAAWLGGRVRHVGLVVGVRRQDVASGPSGGGFWVAGGGTGVRVAPVGAPVGRMTFPGFGRLLIDGVVLEYDVAARVVYLTSEGVTVELGDGPTLSTTEADRRMALHAAYDRLYLEWFDRFTDPANWSYAGPMV